MRLTSGFDHPYCTICQTHRELYRRMIASGYTEADAEIKLLRSAYSYGKKMGARLRQYKNNYDEGWYQKTKDFGPSIDAGESADWIEKLQAQMPEDVGHPKAICHAADILGIEVRRIAEIGVYKGKTSKRLHRHFRTAEINLVDAWSSVDESRIAQSHNQESWDKLYNQIVDRYGKTGRTNIYRMLSMDAAKVIDGPLDIVFIDACHRYSAVKEDIAAWLPKMNRPGLICGHDYNTVRRSVNTGVRKAVNEAFGNELYLGPDLTWFHFLRA